MNLVSIGFTKTYPLFCPKDFRKPKILTVRVYIYTIFIFVHFFVLNQVSGQKFPLQNFSVDKGLIQSQVQSIAQDNQHCLWVATFGGLDRFDGTSFSHFTRTEGLNSTIVTAVYTAKNGNVWAATFKGISCYDGSKIINYPVIEKSGKLNFRAITEDETGTIWAFNINAGLFIFNDNRFINATVPFKGAVPTCLFRSAGGGLLVNFSKEGIYTFKNNKWQKFSQIPFIDKGENIIWLTNSGETYYACTSGKKLIKYSNGVVVAESKVDAKFVRAICMDGKGDIWVGTTNGALVFNGNNLSVKMALDALTGFSDNVVNYIFHDMEGNIWLGTDGDGLFQFSGGSIVKYDKSAGLPGKIIMGVAKDNSENLFIATREAGLIKYNPSDKKIIPIDYSRISKAGINCLGMDKNDNLFLGTMDSKLLKFNGKNFQEIRLSRKSNSFIIAITGDEDKTWFATQNGCYYLKADSIFKINGLEQITIAVLPIENRETLVGSLSGIYLVSGNNAKKIGVSKLKDVEVHCLARFHQFILIGTVNEGVYFWEKETGEVYKCDSKKGLSDDEVYSIFVDSRDNIWAGTGTGIQKIFFNEQNHSFVVKKFSKSDGYENSESNLNAIAEDKQGGIWVGTTKGLFVFNQDTFVKKPSQPYVIIQNVESRTFKDDSRNNIMPVRHLPASPVLPYNKSDISLTVKGIFLTNPESITYSYQLAGLDTSFSQPVKQTIFNYQSLEPGTYTFRVKAIANGEVESANIAEYPFSVSTPFHKSKWFLVLIILSLLVTGAVVQFYFNRIKLRKQKQLESMRIEEHQKIRQRTSEDFHDELGNKLTRISLLTEILQKKTSMDNTDKNAVIMQIKENVLSLYSGTKEIIWSLTPSSDNVVEILARIKLFGQELFQDLEIEFLCMGLEEIDPKIILPADYGLNIVLICKEFLNNSLRHSGCSTVTLVAVSQGYAKIIISIEDNGKGFEKNSITKGNGLNNIQRRADRIGAIVEINAAKDSGTKIILEINLYKKEDIFI